MTWHYHCPNCGNDVAVDWDWHSEEVTCPHCQNHHYPPTPVEDHEAHFVGERWPKELEDAVISLHGTTCEVPGCYGEYSALVHRKPPVQGGRTSVANMIGLCATHARMLGDQDYDTWLAALPDSDRHAGNPSIEITFTDASKPVSSAPAAPPMPPPGLYHVQPLAGRATLPEQLPAGYASAVVSPFLAGPARKLVLHYDWVLGADGAGSVLLIAWPAADPPALARGTEGLAVPQAFAEHAGRKGNNGRGRVVLDLPPGAEGLWVAAVLLRDSGGKPGLLDFLLAGTD